MEQNLNPQAENFQPQLVTPQLRNEIMALVAESMNPQVENRHSQVVTPQLREEIKAIITETMQTQGKEILQTLVNPESQEYVDVVIDDRHRGRMEDMDRIPDVVRSLREFSGNNSEFSSWKKMVDRILSIYTNICGTPKYFGILSVIRNKITGNADQVLESYNTPLNWQAIAKCLTMHYADRRDVSTLEYQMTTLVQGEKSIEEFYQCVYSHLSLILNKILCAEYGQEATSLLTNTYREKALDTFIRGLNGDLPSLLAMREPSDLPQALQLCQKLQNQNFRANHANNAFRRMSANNKPPILPPRKYQQNQQRNYAGQQQPFYPQLAHMPRYNNTNHFHQPMAQQRAPTQMRQQEAEPMEVDNTIQTRRIDYANRNAFNNQKRPASSNNSFPRKHQKTYYLNANEMENEQAATSQELTESEKNNNFADINFLD